MRKIQTKEFFAAGFIILLVAFSRLIPHWPNITAVGASAFWAAYAWPNRKFSWALPLLAVILTDAILGFHDQILWVYGSILFTSIVIQTVGMKFSPGLLLKGSLFSSLVFFLVTNFGVWFSGSLYSAGIKGLMNSYIAGAPYALNDFIGTLLYGSIGLLVIEKFFKSELSSSPKVASK